MSKQQFKRKKKLILPGLQFRLIGAFLGAAGISVLVQSVMLVYALTSIARSAPNDMAIIIDQVGGVSAKVILMTTVVTVWCTVSIGVLVTFRVAGPVYRLKMYLQEIIDGGKPKDCRLRKGDLLMDLCEMINRATEPLRRATGDAEGSPDDRDHSEAPDSALPTQEASAESEAPTT